MILNVKKVKLVMEKLGSLAGYVLRSPFVVL